MRSRIASVLPPKRMRNYHEYVVSSSRVNAVEVSVIPPRHRSEICCASSGIQTLPIRNREVYGSLSVEGETGEVEGEAPIQNIMVWQVPKFPQAVWT
jgi:hypothetical protein